MSGKNMGQLITTKSGLNHEKSSSVIQEKRNKWSGK